VDVNVKYLSIGNWIEKSSGKPMSSLAPINEGTSKEGRPYAFAQTERDRTVKVNGSHAIGSILEATMTLTAEKPIQTAPVIRQLAPAKQQGG